MQSQGPALVRLASGYTFAASEHEFKEGWLHITGQRYWRVGPNNERVRWGASGVFSWPREAVEEVSPVRGLGGAETALEAPVDAAA